jgi:hypothetical protein
MEAGPPDTLLAFIANLSDDDCSLLSLACSAYIDDDAELEMHSPHKAKGWFQAYLDGATNPLHRFGRLTCIIGLLDFELSPFAIARIVARNEQVTQAANKRLAATARRTLQETVPRLSGIASAWKDVRTHELDEAALWVYRDSMQAQQMGELGRKFGPRRSPPKGSR